MTYNELDLILALNKDKLPFSLRITNLFRVIIFVCFSQNENIHVYLNNLFENNSPYKVIDSIIIRFNTALFRYWILIKAL